MASTCARAHPTIRHAPSLLAEAEPRFLELHVLRVETGGGSSVAKCGAQTKTGGRCQRKVVTGTSRCPVHQGPWSAYGVAQRKEKEAKEKKRRIRKKR
ncbi:hypothetical protein GCM10010244_32360 [Streptomyces coeruleorubidus]|nr:hypothetical protein GCM10010244_32360 [Streptomyces bellus]